MNRAWYVLLWAVEILAIVGLVLALTLPVQDYALREYIAWQQHPSSETYKAFLEKRRQESAVGFFTAVPFGVAAVMLSGLLNKYRRKLH